LFIFAGSSKALKALIVQDHVTGEDLFVLFIAIVESRSGARIVCKLGPKFDLWGEPVLPTDADVIVDGLVSGALTLQIVVILAAKRKIIQMVWRVVQIKYGANGRRSAA
jgi:hypothetical protein